jgi:hypothetical protein
MKPDQAARRRDQRAEGAIAVFRCNCRAAPTVLSPQQGGKKMMGLNSRSFAGCLAAVCLVAGCTAATRSSGGSAVTPGPTLVNAPSAALGASPTPSAVACPTLSQADSAAVAAAEAIIEAVGGSVPLAACPRVLSTDPVSGQAGTYVEMDGWQVAWDSKAALRQVISLDSRPQPGPTTTLTESQARARVQGVLTALGVSPGAPDSFVYLGGGVEAEWRARWDRRIDGIRAVGDGTWVNITGAGVFEAYGYVETPILSRPATTITEAQALARFPWCKSSTKSGRTEICTVELVWYGPGVAEGQRPPLRLCWQVQLAWTDGEESGATVVWLDAGTGEEVDSASTM